MEIGGLAVFVLLAVGVIAYAVRYQQPKIPVEPTEEDLRLREWKQTRADLPYGARWTLLWTNRRGVAAPPELAWPAALRAEAMLIMLDMSEQSRQTGPSRRARIMWLLGLSVSFVGFSLMARNWWTVLYGITYPAVATTMTVCEPIRWARSRRRLTTALFANHALVDNGPASPATVSA